MADQTVTKTDDYTGNIHSTTSSILDFFGYRNKVKFKLINQFVPDLTHKI